MEDDVTWVGVNEPDDPLDGLEHMTIAQVEALPDDVVLKTREKYVEAFRRLTDRELA